MTHKTSSLLLIKQRVHVDARHFFHVPMDKNWCICDWYSKFFVCVSFFLVHPTQNLLGLSCMYYPGVHDRQTKSIALDLASTFMILMFWIIWFMIVSKAIILGYLWCIHVQCTIPHIMKWLINVKEMYIFVLVKTHLYSKRYLKWDLLSLKLEFQSTSLLVIIQIILQIQI